VSSQIRELEERAIQLRQDTYARLTPTQVRSGAEEVGRRALPALLALQCGALVRPVAAHDASLPSQRLAVARHPNRPTFLDVALNISDKFVELHGDRAGLDDPAMVCFEPGLGLSIQGDLAQPASRPLLHAACARAFAAWRCVDALCFAGVARRSCAAARAQHAYTHSG